MVEKILKIAILLVALGIVFFLGYKQFFGNDKGSAGIPEKLPKFEYASINGGVINRSTPQKEKFVVVNYFNPNCGICKTLAEELQKNLRAFKQTEFLFISKAPIGEIKEFAQTYRLADEPNFYFGTDPTLQFFNDFGEAQAPVIFIFNPNRELLHFKLGEISAVEILKIIQTPSK